MGWDLQQLARNALQQRLDDSEGHPSTPMASEPVQWLLWAMLRDTANMLSVLQIPAFVALRDRLRAAPGERAPIPDMTFTPPEQYFLKLAMVVASHHLVRLPEYGAVWNSVQAQRMEIRQLVERLEAQGHHDRADQLRKKMPPALRRADMVDERKQREAEESVRQHPGLPSAGQTPPPPVTIPSSGGVRL